MTKTVMKNSPDLTCKVHHSDSSSHHRTQYPPTVLTWETSDSRVTLQTRILPNDCNFTLRTEIFESERRIKYVVSQGSPSDFSLYGWSFDISRVTYKLTAFIDGWQFSPSNPDPRLIITSPVVFNFTTTAVQTLDPPHAFDWFEPDALDEPFWPGAVPFTLPQNIRYRQYV